MTGPDEPANSFHVIPYDFASEIAYIISGWARLEYEIDALIWELAGLYDDPDIGACLTAQFSNLGARFNALIALARLKGIAELNISKLNKFKESANGIADRRNRVAHDPWLAAYDDKLEKPKEVYRLQKTARGHLQHLYKSVSLDELRNLKNEIETAISRFGDLKHMIFRILYSSP
jgi:hypothetical protein